MDYQYYDEPDYIDDDGDGLVDEDGEGEDIYGDGNEAAGNRYTQQDYTGNWQDQLWDSYEECALPSLLQVLSYLLPLLTGCLLCRLLSALYLRQRRQQSSTTVPPAALHLIQAGCGLSMLYVTLGERMWLLLLLLGGISYVLLLLVRLFSVGPNGAVTIAVLSIGSQFVYELVIWRQREDWAQLRGLQMVANMKLISLAFDLATAGGAGGAAGLPHPLAFAGYIYSPASCVLGPWISYGRYLDSLCHKPRWQRNLLQLCSNLLLSLVALIVSNCIAPALAEHQQQRLLSRSHWLLMYTGAVSVRSSHYFVSFVSQALLAAAGQRLDETRRASGSSSSCSRAASSRLLGDLVSRPWHIEWPHSLSDLVRSWNIPMHEWLKRYVYGHAHPRRSRHNTIISVFCTYVVSSLLHGMDLRIYLVLLSLATFAQGEAMLRRHLAALCHACVSANRCPGAERCRYSHCPRRRGWRCCSSWLVGITNLGFTLLAIAHLAYLGVVLLNETLELETSGQEVSYLYHWASAGYLSHYIGIGMFVLYLFIS